MTSRIKAALLAGTFALAATLGAVAAEAGGRHNVPFVPYSGYLPSAYDDDSYGCDDCAYGYGDTGSDVLDTARRVTRDTLGVDIRDVIDEIAE